MKKIVFSSLAIISFLGCGGGGSSSSSQTSQTIKEPKIVLSTENLDMKLGETKSVRIKALDIPDSAIIETNITHYPNKALNNPVVVDYITDTISHKNDKDINLLLYGANVGSSIITFIPDFNPSNKILRAVENYPRLVINVKNNLTGIDEANNVININNKIITTSIYKIFKFGEQDVSTKLELQTPSECGEFTSIDKSDMQFSLDDKKVLINLNLFRYNIQGDREFSKVITVLDVTSQEIRDKGEIVVIPPKAKEFSGMNFALNGVDINNTYEIELGTDMCKAKFKLTILNLFDDSDKDGVRDDVDSCLNTPFGSKVNEFGCSIDKDSDGFADDEDECPTEVGTLNGCPDKDGDGVADKDDLCPIEAGTIDTKGCPDSDGDGIADKDDLCPSEAGTIDTKGCPDSDGDGIADKDDLCPEEFGVKPDGCPLPTPATTTSGGSSTSTTSTSSGGNTVVNSDADACTTKNGYSVASHKVGDSSFSNGYVYFRTLTPYILKLYYKTPISRAADRSVNLNSYDIPDTSYKFFLEISNALATGSAFYIDNKGKCYKSYFPTEESISGGVFPDKTLIFVK